MVSLKRKGILTQSLRTLHQSAVEISYLIDDPEKILYFRIMNSLFNFLLRIVDFYTLLIFAYVVLSWLFHFKVLSFNNMFLVRMYDGLKKMTDPPLDYIRRYIPNLGGIDIAPVILILIIYLLKDLLIEYWPIS